MAAFAISYKGLTRGDIRHIYSYRSPQIYIPAPRHFGRCQQFLSKPLIEKYPPRFYDYYPAFNMGLPRAPAFNRMPAESIREMVERMRKPIACQKREHDVPMETESTSKDHVKVRKKGVKAVRFRSPAPEDTDSEERDHGTNETTKKRRSSEKSENNQENEVNDDLESEMNLTQNYSPLKVKVSEKSPRKLPSLTAEKKKEKHKKRAVSHDKKGGATLTLPPISK